MPTYEYRCDACRHEFEKFQSITSAPIKKCPKCGKNKVKRLISSGAGLIFKGSGFYITDYRDAGYKDKAKADSGDAGGGGGDGESAATDGAKSESKSEAKPDAKPAQTAKPAAEAKPKSEPKPKSEGPKKSKD